jgi:hypothetical protein
MQGKLNIIVVIVLGFLIGVAIDFYFNDKPKYDDSVLQMSMQGDTIAYHNGVHVEHIQSDRCTILLQSGIRVNMIGGIILVNEHCVILISESK